MALMLLGEFESGAAARADFSEPEAKIVDAYFHKVAERFKVSLTPEQRRSVLVALDTNPNFRLVLSDDVKLLTYWEIETAPRAIDGDAKIAKKVSGIFAAEFWNIVFTGVDVPAEVPYLKSEILFFLELTSQFPNALDKAYQLGWRLKDLSRSEFFNPLYFSPNGSWNGVHPYFSTITFAWSLSGTDGFSKGIQEYLSNYPKGSKEVGFRLGMSLFEKVLEENPELAQKLDARFFVEEFIPLFTGMNPHTRTVVPFTAFVPYHRELKKIPSKDASTTFEPDYGDYEPHYGEYKPERILKLLRYFKENAKVADFKLFEEMIAVAPWASSLAPSYIEELLEFVSADSIAAYRLKVLKYGFMPKPEAGQKIEDRYSRQLALNPELRPAMQKYVEWLLENDGALSLQMSDPFMEPFLTRHLNLLFEGQNLVKNQILLHKQCTVLFEGLPKAD